MNNKLSNKQHAQQQLIHALLQDVYQDKQLAQQQTEQRINKVMEEINRPQSNSKLVQFPVKKNYWLSLAASVCLLVITLSIWVLPTNPALAEVNNLIERLANLGDRLYKINLAPIDTQPINKTNWLDDSRLYVRGKDHYVFVQTTDKGRLIRGRDISSSWKLDHKQQIKYYADLSDIKIPIAGDAIGMAFMDFASLLTNLTEKYQLSYQAQSEAIGANGLALSRITANKNAKQKGVKQVVIYYQADNYQIERIVFNKVHLKGDPALFNLSLQLENTKLLADDFFTAQYHLNMNTYE
ncbi:hypothetical protein [Catenovulum maritimum]|uniref:Uncharacterized protein n=1 Tax=Catenovulum maritimum TaxID=1513271 RepID=A0A0J8GNR2_9ALTE|nr:hypothetical protein [Catenovulum maritimum]KMT64422.1 hypothetical protein XM47_14075 [Catenovulum maritimum]